MVSMKVGLMLPVGSSETWGFADLRALALVAVAGPRMIERPGPYASVYPVRR